MDAVTTPLEHIFLCSLLYTTKDYRGRSWNKNNSPKKDCAPCAVFFRGVVDNFSYHFFALRCGKHNICKEVL